MISLKETVVVEGKYDKARLADILDAHIITTDGFGIFKDLEKQRLLKRLAEKNGLIVITDSDAAGFRIRSFLSGSVDKTKIKHVYIPDIFGKESRKTSPSKEGKIGVEGMPTTVLLDALNRCGVFCEEVKKQPSRQVTVADLHEDGISGRKNSSLKRKELLKKLDLPERMSTSSLLNLINTFYSFDEYKCAIASIVSSEME